MAATVDEEDDPNEILTLEDMTYEPEMDDPELAQIRAKFFKKLVKKVKKKAKKVVKKVKKTVKKVKKKAKKVVKKVKKKVKKVAKKVKKHVKKTVKKVKKHVKKTVKKVKKIGKDIHNGLKKAYGHISSHALKAIKGVARYGKYAYNWVKRTAAKAGKWLKNAAKVVGKNLVKFAKLAWKFLKGVGKINSWCIGNGLISTCRFGLTCFMVKCVPNVIGLGIMLGKGAIGCVKQGLQSVKKLYSFIKVLASNPRSGPNFKSFLAATRTFMKCFMNKAMSHYDGFYDNI